MSQDEKYQHCKNCEHFWLDENEGISYCKLGKKMIGWFLAEDVPCPKGNW